MSMANVLSRTIQFENNFQNFTYNRKISLSYFISGFQDEGLFFSRGYNATYNNSRNVIPCGKGLYTYDPRCRPWYTQTIKEKSIKIFQPNFIVNPMFTQKVSQMCQKAKILNKETLTLQLYSVLCLDVQLTSLINYYQYITSPTMHLYLIEPLSQLILIDTKAPNFQRVTQTFQEIELQYLTNQEQAQHLNNTIKSKYGSYIDMKTNQIQLNQKNNNFYQDQEVISYKRNDTQTTVILDPIFIYDKYLEQEDKNSYKYQMDLAYLSIFIISDEKLKEQADQVEYFFKRYFLIVNISLGISGIIFILVTLNYAFTIKNVINRSVQNLTQVLQHIIDKDLSSQIFDLKAEDLFHSQETSELFQALKEIYQILLYTSENFFSENKTSTLLKLYKNIEFFKQFGNIEALGITLNNIGNILISQNHFFEAIEIFQSSIIYAKYQIQYFCEKYPNSYSAKILNDVSFLAPKRNKVIFRFLFFLKQVYKIAIEIYLSNQYFCFIYQILQFFQQQSEQYFQKPLVSLINNNSQKLNESSNFKIFSNTQETQFLFSQNRTVLGRQNEFLFMKRKTAITKLTDEQENEEFIELLSNYCFRKRNYIISLYEFQIYYDSQNKQNKSYNFWKEIKQLLYQQINILSQLPYSEFIQMEMYLMISRCYLSLNKLEKANNIIRDCDNFIINRQKQEAYQDSELLNQSNTSKFNFNYQDKKFLEESKIKDLKDSVILMKQEITQNNNSFNDFSTMTRQQNQGSIDKNKLINFKKLNQSSNQIKDISFISNNTLLIQSQIENQQNRTRGKAIYLLFKDKQNQYQQSKILKKLQNKKKTSQGLEQKQQQIQKLNEIQQKENEILIETFFSFLRENDAQIGNKNQLLTYYSPYFFSLRFEYFKAQVLIILNKYQEASTILTNLLEDRQYFISNYEFATIQSLNEIFIQNNIISEDLDQFKRRFNTKIQFQIGLIFECTENTNHIVNSLQLLSNLSSEILTYEKDQICITLIDKNDKNIQEYLALATMQSIKKLINMILQDIFKVIYNDDAFIFFNIVKQMQFKSNNVYINENIFSTKQLQVSYMNKEQQQNINQQEESADNLLYSNLISKNQTCKNENCMGSLLTETKQQSLKTNNLFSKKLQILDQTYKIQENNGDSFQNFNSRDIISVQKLEVNNKQHELNQNYSFHISIQKTIIQIISTNLHYYSKKQNKNVNQQNNSMQINNQILQQKFIIYSTNQIQIKNNALFEKLAHQLFILDIQLLIYSNTKGMNFLEQQQLQTYTYQNTEIIKVFYTNQNLQAYLNSRRSKDIKSTYPYIIQYF